MPSTKYFPEFGGVPPLAYASFDGAGDILLFAIVFCCILFLAYIVSKLVGKRAQQHGRSRHIEVVDSLFVGADAQLVIVRAADEYFLISKSAKRLEMLAKLDIAAEEAAALAGAEAGAGFAESFKSLLEKKLSMAARRQGGGAPGVFRGNIERIRDIALKAGGAAGGPGGAKAQDGQGDSGGPGSQANLGGRGGSDGRGAAGAAGGSDRAGGANGDDEETSDE
ncbi:MAG: flagellar biosynthetic protein FliO [Clostridiales bacterium]|jgi:flagellar protein FliO/FliZ|nr:flagellar biosynthetic protein FliO [Clostridiales bacterium]